MKKIALSSMLLFMLFYSSAFGKYLEVATEEEMTMTQVVEIPGQSKDQLFEKAKIWLAETASSSKEVIQYESKEEGKIVGKASILHYSSILGPPAVQVGNLAFQVLAQLSRPFLVAFPGIQAEDAA